MLKIEKQVPIPLEEGLTVAPETPKSYKPEKGIPIPHREYGMWREVALKMEVGESVFFPTLAHAPALHAGLKNAGFKAVTRKVEDGYRVWRIK